MGRQNRAKRRGLAFEQCEPRIALSGDTSVTPLNITILGGNLEGGFVQFDYDFNGKVGPGQILGDVTNLIIRDGVIVNGVGTYGGTTANFSDSLNWGVLKPTNNHSDPVGVPASRRPNGVAEAKFAPKLIPAPPLTEPYGEGGSIDVVAMRSNDLLDMDPDEGFSKELYSRTKGEPLRNSTPAIIPDASEAESLRGRAVLMEVAFSAMPTQPRKAPFAVANSPAEVPIPHHDLSVQIQVSLHKDDETVSPKLPTNTKVGLAPLAPISVTVAHSRSSDPSPPMYDHLATANVTPLARDRAFAEIESAQPLAVAAAVSDPKSHALSGLTAAVILAAAHSYRGLCRPVESDPIEQRPPRRSRRFRGGNS